MQAVQSALKNFEEIIVGTLVVAMSLAALINVICRYFLNSPISWAEEFAGDCFIWLVFFGAVVCTKQKRHIAVDALVTFLPKPLQSVCHLVVDVFVLGLMAVLLYYGSILMVATTQRTANLGIPKYYIYSVVPITATLGFLYSLRDLHRDFNSAMGRGEPS
jgi:TRAP-type C4-dicarboxylate transport system permease small subunit